MNLWRGIKENKNILHFLSLLTISAAARQSLHSGLDIYLPKTIRYFGIPWESVGHYIAAINALKFSVTSVGIICVPYFIKLLGEWKAFIYANLCTGVAAVAFGFSWNIICLFVTLFFLAFLNGIITIIQTIAYRLCTPQNEVLVLVLTITYPITIGSLIGPIFGGFLALPKDQGIIEIPSRFFESFPVLLPNAIIGIVMILIAIVASRVISPEKTIELVVSNDNLGTYQALKTSERIKVNKDSSMWKALLKNKSFIFVSILYTLVQCANSAYISTLNIWLETPHELSGMELEPKVVGTLMVAASLIALLFEMYLIHKANERVGHQMCLVLWCLASEFLIPLTIYLGDFSKNIYFELALILLLGINFICMSGRTTALNMYLKDSVDKSDWASASSMASTCSYLMRGLATLIAGNLFSWSLKNEAAIYEYGLGYPLDHNFVFLLLSLLYMVAAVIGGILPTIISN